MASHTQTEIKAAKRQSTAPASPAGHQKKGLNFFKRHLGPRRRSSVSFPAGQQPPSPQTSAHHPPQAAKAPSEPQETPESSRAPSSTVSSSQSASEPPPPPSPTRPKSALRQSSITSQDSSDFRRVLSNDTTGTSGTTATSGDDRPAHPRHNSKSSGVKWAASYDDDGRTRSRPRRTSSTGTSGRKTSIYARGDNDHYLQGVESGVGSKARRLSVQIPTNFEVDECPLSDHFSIFVRKGKKETLGEGGAAVVRLMQSKTAGGAAKDKLFAVKEFRDWESEEEDEHDYKRKIQSEYAIAKSCHHPNIVETYRLCVDSNHKWFHVMEYCELGDLNDLINKRFLSPEDRNCLFKQLLRGVDYLHSRGIAHRDLKSENLLVSRTGCLKIADFGTAEVYSGTHPGLKGCRRPSLIPPSAEIRLCPPSIVGSAPYMAPEIIAHKDAYDPRGVDVWACAVVYLTLTVGGTPWSCASADVKNFNIFASTWDEWLLHFPDGNILPGRPLPRFAQSKQWQGVMDPTTKMLVMGMMNPDPTHRWSIRECLESKTVTDAPCCQQEGYSDDIRTRQRKVLHNHTPPAPKEKSRTAGFLKPKFEK